MWPMNSNDSSSLLLTLEARSALQRVWADCISVQDSSDFSAFFATRSLQDSQKGSYGTPIFALIFVSLLLLFGCTLACHFVA